MAESDERMDEVVTCNYGFDLEFLGVLLAGKVELKLRLYRIE